MNAEAGKSWKLFVGVLVCVLAVKMLLSAILPITSDEAYFCIWAGYPDFGYYDHPPMAGWLLSLLLPFGRSLLMVRLMSLLLTFVIGSGIYLLMRGRDEERAGLVAALFLVSPVSVFTVPMTTDTPLVIFCFLSAVCLFQAMRSDRMLYYILSGVFLGLAFLSKYFAVLLALAYVVFFAFSPDRRRLKTGYAVLFACVVPFALVNVYWNYQHCWVNVLFNLLNRNKGDVFSPFNAVLFIASQVLLITPPLLYYLLRRRRGEWRTLAASPLMFFAFLYIVPMGIFALMSCRKLVGLHWVLAFYPFFYISAGMMMTVPELYRVIRQMAWFSLIILVPVTVLLVTKPVYWLKNSSEYGAVVMSIYHDEVLAHLKSYGHGFYFATSSYADSAILSYYSGKYFPVFGGGSLHGRQDDIITDFRALDRGNILILRKGGYDAEDYEPYFRRIEVTSFFVRGAEYTIIAGYKFNFDEYRDRVLTVIRDKYYSMPAWLPCPADGGYFFEKYFPIQPAGL